MKPSRLAVCCLLLALPVAAQLDSAALRRKFGPPLNRETFHVRPGFDITVDYGAKHQVCRMEIPTSVTREATKQFIEELIPAKEGLTVTGSAGEGIQSESLPTTHYEQLYTIEWGTPTVVQVKGVACKP